MSGDSAYAGAVTLTVLGPGKTQDDVRTSFSGRFTRQKRWGGRGTGALKATGSYEGSLSVEGTSGCHEPSLFTKWWSRRPWRLPHAGERRSSQESKAALREGSAKAHRSFRGSRERRQRCQRLDRNGRRGQTTSTPESSARRRDAKLEGQGSACPSFAIRRSVRECREALGTLVNRIEPKTRWGVHAVKAAERAGNARGTGVRSIIQVAEVGRTHRAPCPP